MKLTVTGAAGKLGAVVCRHLVSAGHQVRATDKSFRADLPVPLVVADLLRPEAAYELLAGSEALVHLANHPQYRGTDAQRLFSENVAMNFNLFQAARELELPRIVFSSSVQVLGETLPPYLPFDSALPARPANPYALSKQLSELMLAYWADKTRGSAVALRLPWLVTDPQRAAIASSGGTFHPNPHEAFAFLHYQDAATLIAAVLDSELPGFRVYLAAARQNRFQKSPAELIPQFYPQVPLREPAETLAALVDIGQITRETGWQPVHSQL